MKETGNRELLRKVLFVAAFATSATVLIPCAFAQERGWYIGASLGQSKTKFDQGSAAADLAAAGANNTGFTADETDTGWKLYGGYKFTRYLAVEGGYVNAGRFSLTTNVTNIRGIPFPPLRTSFDIKIKEIFDIAAVGILPIGNQFSLFGKLGAYRANTELSFSVSTVSEKESGRNNDFMWGFGAGYDFSKNLGARIEWERFNKVGDKEKTGQGDVNLLSAGLVYRF